MIPSDFESHGEGYFTVWPVDILDESPGAFLRTVVNLVLRRATTTQHTRIRRYMTSRHLNLLF